MQIADTHANLKLLERITHLICKGYKYKYKYKHKYKYKYKYRYKYKQL